MKLFVCLLLAILPLAMGAGHQDDDYGKMMSDFEKESKMYGWWGPDEDRKKDEDCDEDKDEEEGLRKMMKELGMEMGEWREKMKEWMGKWNDWHGGDDDSRDKDGDDDDDSREKPDSEEQKKKMKMYKEFHKFLEYKAKEKDAKEKKEEMFKSQVHQFQNYLKLKKMQEYEKKKKEMQKEQAKEYEHSVEMLRKKYMNLTHEYQVAKFKFTFSITNQVLDICQCDGRKSMIMRLKDGDFGQHDMGDRHGNESTTHGPTHSPPTGPSGPTGTPPWGNSTWSPDNSTWSPDNSTWSPDNSNGPSGGSTRPSGGSTGPPGGSTWPTSTSPPVNNMTHPNATAFPNATWSPPQSTPSGHDGDEDDGGLSREEIMEVVWKLAYMKPEEQFVFALHKLSKNMCDFAGVYMDHLMEVEKAVYEYMQGGSNMTAWA